MNKNAKTEVVNSAKRLLDVFLQLIGNTVFHGFSIRAGAVNSAESELRLEAAGQKLILLVLPRLNASRKLLRHRPEPAGAGVKPSIVACPHIPDLLAEDLKRAGINHADLNGRLFIQTPGFVADREPKGRRYRNPGSAVKLFALKTARLIRALLAQRDEVWTQEGLAARTKVSRALISVALADLIEEEYVTQLSGGNRHQAATYRLNDFDRLLDAWRAEDQWSKRGSIQQYSLLTNDVLEIANTVRSGLGEKNVFFTQWFAAHLRHPYTTPPLVSAYVTAKSLLEIPIGRKVPVGGNLWLIVPQDEGVFQETQQAGGFNLVSDIQIYLDLLQVSQRGPEQAQALREWEGFAR
jgi:hypothetical protein